MISVFFLSVNYYVAFIFFPIYILYDVNTAQLTYWKEYLHRSSLFTIFCLLGPGKAMTISISPMNIRSSERACFKNQSSETVRFKKRSTAMYKNSSWSFFQMINAFTWSIFEIRICTWSNSHWRDRFPVTERRKARIWFRRVTGILFYTYTSLEPWIVFRSSLLDHDHFCLAIMSLATFWRWNMTGSPFARKRNHNLVLCFEATYEWSLFQDKLWAYFLKITSFGREAVLSAILW